MVSVILAVYASFCDSMTSSRKPEVYITYCIVVQGGPSHRHR